jgi:hypothetical protein
MIVTAIMGIIMLIFSPMISAFLRAQDRLYNQSKVDSRLNEVVEIIKRDVRNGRSSGSLGGEPIGVFDDTNHLITDGSVGKKVVIRTVDLTGNPKYIQYTVDGTKLRVNSEDTFSITTGGSIILSDVEMGEFKYDDKILLFHFKIKVPDKLDGKVRNEVRDVGISRINLSY